MSPDALPPQNTRAWRIRRSSDTPAVTNWLRLEAAGAADPAATWRGVQQPLLAIWGTRDDRIPIRASAMALRSALAAGPNRDRTFRWFNAGHGGAVAYRDGDPVYAPGLLEETARWLGLHLGTKRAKTVTKTPLPPASGPQVVDVADASTIYSLPIQALWLVLPALMLALGAWRARSAPAASAPAASAPAASARAASARLVAAAFAAGAACLAAIAAGAYAVVHSHPDAVAEIGGMPWPFALAFVLAALLAASVLALVRQRTFLAATGAVAWLILALFWLF